MAAQLEHHDVEAEYEDVSSVVSDNEEIERDILAELGQMENAAEFELRVFRVPEKGGKRIWLFNLPGARAGEILETLRDKYGSGKYEIRNWQTVNGKTKAAKNHRIEIDIETPRAAPQADQPVQDHALTAMVQQQGAALAMALQQIAEMKREPVSPQPPVDIGAMMGSVARIMREIREISPPAPPPPPPPVSPLEMLTGVISLVRDLKDDGREKSLAEIVSEFVQSDFMRAVVGAQNPAATALPAAPPQNALAVQPQPPAPPQNPASQMDAETQALVGYIRMLCSRAARGGDVALAADMIVEDVPEQQLRMLLAMPDPVGAMTVYVPAVASHAAWFRLVMSEVAAALSEDGLTAVAAADDNATGARVENDAVLERASGQRAASVSVDVPSAGSGGRS